MMVPIELRSNKINDCVLSFGLHLNRDRMLYLSRNCDTFNLTSSFRSKMLRLCIQVAITATPRGVDSTDLTLFKHMPEMNN